MGAASRKKGRGQYRSGLEHDFAQCLEQSHVPFVYEKTKLKFVQPEKKRTYVADFDIGGTIYETKGRLTREDRQKMLWVKEQHPEKRIVFVFSNSNKPITKGSPTTYGMWCEKNGFEYLDIKEVKENTDCISSGTRKKVNSKSQRLPSRRRKK